MAGCHYFYHFYQSASMKYVFLQICNYLHLQFFSVNISLQCGCALENPLCK